MKALFLVLMSCIVMLGSPDVRAVPIPIDNGVTGDGAWEVTVESGGDSRSGILDPAGPIGPNNVIFELATYVDAGADGGAVRLSDTNITGEPTLTAPGQVSSGGTFAGPNGPVNWSAVSRIAPGTLVYQNTVTFTSSAPFGALRVSCYLDEDVLGAGDDIMVLFGTPGQSDFNVLTVDNTDNFGVSHAAGYLSAVNATYIGWAADEFSDLRSAITSTGASYSIPGVINTTSLPPITDARYPGRPVFGPNDITNAFAFDLSPTATTATVACSLGGLPTGQPPALTISKSAAATVAVGSDLTYTIRYANLGPASSGVVITDRLPMGTTFVSASNGGTLSGDTVTWNIGDLPANSGERTLTLVVRVGGVAGSVITNSQYSISCPCMPSVTGPPVSTTLTAGTVVIPPVATNASACAVVALPDTVRASTLEVSSDGNFLFLYSGDSARVDPRCALLGRGCDAVGEISVYNRAAQATRALTTNSVRGWDRVYALSGNRAWLASGDDANFTYTNGRLTAATLSGNVGGQSVTLPATGGEIVLANAATGSLMPLRTPFRTASTAAGLTWSGHFEAASYDGNRIVLVELAYDSQGVLVDGGLNLVDIAAQTSFDLFNRISTAAHPGSITPSTFLFLTMSGDGNRLSFSSPTVLIGANAGTAVLAVPGNIYRLRELAYVFDVAANSLILVADPDTSRARAIGSSSSYFVRELGATGTLIALDRTVPFRNTPGNPEQNGELYIAQPGIAITQVTSTALPRSGNYLSPGVAFMTPNERFVYFHAEQDLVGRNADQSNELFRFDLQTGQLRQVTTRFDALADLMAFLGQTSLDGFGNNLLGNETSFDGRFVLMSPSFLVSTTVDLGGGARAVVDELPTLFDCQ